MDPTDCPLCRKLCIWPSILPCGRAICRKCLRKTLERGWPTPSCPSCGQRLPGGQEQTSLDLADMYAKDPILEAMVLDKLGGEGDVMCRVCPNKEATQICLDCADKYCDTCSHAHMKMTFSQDHMQAQLSELSEMNQVAPAASRVSLTTENLNRDTLLQEAALCDELEAQLKFSIDSIDTSLKALETLRQRLEEQECLLAAYATRCANPDDFVMVIARTMLPRLRRVREDCVAPSDAELSTLTQYSNAVIHSVDRSADHLSGEMQGPMKSVPRKLFLLPPDTPTDTNKSGSFITALAATEDGLLVMVDENNKMIKTADLANPRRAVHSKVLLTMPHGVTLFQDKQNLGAVTASDKKCLRKLLDSDEVAPLCPLCKSMVPGYKQNLVPQMVDTFPRDPVLEELVKQQIGSFGKLPCTVCPDKNVSMICRDCGDQYCDECSYAHAKMTFSLEHVQLDVEKIFKAPPVKHEGEIPSVYSPCGGMNREMLVHEAGLCQDGVSRLQNAISIITSNIARLRESRNRLEADRQLVVTYTAQLKKPNDVLLSSTRVMLPRLKCLREDCRPPNPGALARLTPYVESLTRPLPGIASANVEVFPALTAVPKRGFLTTVEVKEDFARKGPLVKAIVAKENGKLIVTDENNKMIKVLDVSKPGITCVGISLGSVPRGLTLLHDNPNKVAVTTDLKCIYFLDVGSFPKQEVPMACASPSQPDITDCPVCQSLCLSPTILTCGHLVCRKCLRKTLETKGPNPACPVCGHKLQFPSGQGQTINELADSFAKDLILEDLVTEKLAGQGHKVCLACPNKAATKVCLDCGDMYCAACSNAHKKMTVSKDHVQQDLPQTLLNAPTSSTRPTRTARQLDDIISSSPSEDSIRYSHDTREQPQDMNKETLKKATRLCEKGASRLKEAITVVDNNMIQLQEVKKRLESQQQLLKAYVTRLARPDDVRMANARAMLPRLKRVCEESLQPSQASLTKLTQLVNSLMKTRDKVTPSGHTFDPMTATPRKMFVIKPESDAEKENPSIVAIVATDDGRLIMTDQDNRMVKTADLANPTKTVKSVTIDAMPLRLTLVNDSASEVAVTADEKHIYFVD
ncbi:hypothetical protein BaRGS_00029787, partial [Batillaria attramentaria]